MCTTRRVAWFRRAGHGHAHGRVERLGERCALLDNADTGVSQFDEADGELGELATKQRLHGKKARAAAQTVSM
jgi:alpha-D-ribose 1-methylphosphonate 5-triphosphate synthase subunit PhnG